MKTVKTDKAPQAIGPYSQAKIIGNFIFTSGQIPLKIDGTMVVDNFEEECIQVLDNLKAILEYSGSGMSNIIKLTVYLTDLSNFNILNKIFEQYFDNSLPARSTLEVSALPKDSRVEIEAIGYINE
ncbi:MAG: reactive intermediate/imine deaminase [Candidatus Marinimicrobia bacterium]|nr:reactive intermediate/imine deaminase [Candidatus Neomarinimicrobiota bacterium]